MSNNPSADSIRSFIAIPLLPGSVDWCENRVAAMRSHFNNSGNTSSLRWVPSQNLHITLVFLGSQPEQALLELAERLSVILKTCRGFVVPTFRLCGFPDAKSRILALELNATPALLALQEQVTAAVLDVGIRLTQSHGRFRPHITLARVRSGAAPITCAQALDQTFTVQSVALFESQHGARGVHYRARARFELE